MKRSFLSSVLVLISILILGGTAYARDAVLALGGISGGCTDCLDNLPTATASGITIIGSIAISHDPSGGTIYIHELTAGNKNENSPHVIKPDDLTSEVTRWELVPWWYISGASVPFTIADLRSGVSNLMDKTGDSTMIATWDTAYGWGDHSSQNYLDKDTDPYLSGSTPHESEHEIGGGWPIDIESLTSGTSRIFDKGTDTLDNVPNGTTYKLLTSAKEGYIDQDVGSGSAPTLGSANMTGNISVFTNDANYLDMDSDPYLTGVTDHSADHNSGGVWEVNHDNLAGFASNEHVPENTIHSKVTGEFTARGAVGTTTGVSLAQVYELKADATAKVATGAISGGSLAQVYELKADATAKVDAGAVSGASLVANYQIVSLGMGWESAGSGSSGSVIAPYSFAYSGVSFISRDGNFAGGVSVWMGGAVGVAPDPLVAAQVLANASGSGTCVYSESSGTTTVEAGRWIFFEIMKAATAGISNYTAQIFGTKN